MADVSGLLQLLWFGQSTQTLSGPVWPTCTVKLRQGRFERAYEAWAGEAINALIAGGNNTEPYQATWTPDGDYVDLPGIYKVTISQAFDNNGLTIATIDMENISFQEEGVSPAQFHIFDRGHFSPFRGFAPAGRLGWDPSLQNEWYQVLNKKQQITITQGYIGEEAKTFTGLIDNIDLAGSPTRITITCRDFGQTLTDQRLFGNVKDPYLKDPVTFVDRRTAEKLEKVGYDAKAASEDVTGKYPAEFVIDEESSTYWRSRKYETPSATDWIQIRVPEGRYQTFYLWPRFAGMRAYFSIYVKPRDDGKPCKLGNQILNEGWIGIGEGGIGIVPGDNGGIPYIKQIENLSSQGHYHTFGVDKPALEVGAGSIIRVSFRDLARVSLLDLPPGEQGGAYRAGVRRMIAIRRSLTKEALKKRWVLVDDVSDAIKIILRWAGFKEWDIESTGVSLKRPVVFNRGMFLIDCINKFAESTNYVFFINDPSADEDSIGVPTFRQSRVITEDLARAMVRDTDLLTGIRAKVDDEPLAYVIRVRGRAVSAKKGGKTLGGSATKRIMFTFFPPWSGREGQSDDLSGLYKHVIHMDPKLTTPEDCEFACYYIALKEALQNVIGDIQIPAFPGFELDSFALVQDSGTGLFTRLWISNRETTFISGEQASYVQTLGGTWVDTPNVIAMKEIIQQALLTKSNE